MTKKLESKQLAVTFAVWCALLMVALWLLANVGLYVSAAEQMMKWHMFFDLSPAGLIGGVIEAMVMSVVLVYTFVFVYNWLGKSLK